MVEIIETNLSGPVNINEESIQIIDHQSRIINADSWEQYVSFYLNPENEILREKFPRTLSKQGRIYNLKTDDFHLSCIIQRELPTYRLAYIKGECF